ncbi:RDD family protein [Streptomyces sp. NPDC006355]|uniref:RDD family protein n=1 Tax=Streptomyces sp. NPDC006355 TaxID=3156758 RepID=UPI0033B25541
MSAPTPAPGDDRPREGYYPDPSIPGYVRYWNGASWVPGTSRPAPKDGESLAPPPGAGAPAASVEETGPHFFDEDPVEDRSAADAQHGSRPEPASAWGADRSRQSGFGGGQDRRVSWGAPQGAQGAQGADPRVAPGDRQDRQPDGESAARPAEQEESAAAAGSTFVFRRPKGESGGGAAASADRPDEGTMTFRAVSPRTGPGTPPSAGDAPSAGPGGKSGAAGFGSQGPAGAAFGAPGAPGAPGGAAGSGGGPAGSGFGGQAGAAGRGGSSGASGAAGSGSGPAGSGFGGQSGAAGRGGSSGASGFGPAGSGGSGGSGGGSAGPAFGAQAAGSGGGPAGPAFSAQGGAAPAGAPDRPGFGAGKAAAARAAAAQAGAAASTALSGPQAAPTVPPQSGGPQPGGPQVGGPQPGAVASAATPLSPGPGGGQSSWAQQVHRLAGAGGDDEQPVAPWKPPVDDPFQAAARRQAAARPAGLGKRLAARLLDTVVLAGLTAVAAVPLGGKAIDHVNEKIDAAKLSGETVTVWLLDGTTSVYLGIILAVLLLAGVVSEVLPTAKWGRTLGKKLMGLEVRDIEGHDAPEFGAALRRWLVYSVPGLLAVGLVGVAWCLFDKPWRQCWHDKAAHTFVAG